VMLKNKIKGITCLWKQNMTFDPCNFETQKFLVMENCVRLKKKYHRLFFNLPNILSFGLTDKQETTY
jgi:hypothetical protein